MKIVTMIARYLLGLIFLVFGLNKFLGFLPMPPLPTGAAGQFFTVLVSTHYIYFVGAFEVVSAILLLVNRYVPLALMLLAPVIFNIALFHTLMAPSGLPLAGFVIVLWLLVAYRVRSGVCRHLQPAG